MNTYFSRMIAQLSGKFLHKTPTRVVVDTQGVGYDVQISLNTYTDIQALESGTLLTYLKVSEDAMTLFGFSQPAEKELFVKLLGVSGVGATTARMMLSHLKPHELAQAIVTGQVRTLEGIKGIGKKTAERIVLELRDKLGEIKASQQPIFAGEGHNTAAIDALDALVALGINKAMAEQALKKVIPAAGDKPTVESLIKMALQSM
jgi:holliday junction DNA helicase RuvA